MDSRVRGNDEIMLRRTRTCCGPVGAGRCVRGIREFKRSRSLTWSIMIDHRRKKIGRFLRSTLRSALEGAQEPSS